MYLRVPARPSVPVADSFLQGELRRFLGAGVEMDRAAGQADEALSRFIGDLGRILYEPETGAYASKGLSALERWSGVGAALDESLQKQASAIADPVQREEFAKRAATLALPEVRAYGVWARGEGKAGGVETKTAFYRSLLRHGLASAENALSRLMHWHAAGLEDIEKRGKEQGLASGEIKAKQDVWTAIYARDAIASNMERAPETAAEHLQAFYPLLPGDLKAEMTCMVDEGLAWGNARTAADAVFVAPPSPDVEQGAPIGTILGLPAATPAPPRPEKPSPVQNSGGDAVLTKKQKAQRKAQEAARLARDKAGWEQWEIRRREQEDRERLEMAHFQVHLENYGGNVPLAFLSYRQGAGAASALIEAVGDPRRSPVPRAVFLKGVAAPDLRTDLQRIMGRLGEEDDYSVGGLASLAAYVRQALRHCGHAFRVELPGSDGSTQSLPSLDGDVRPFFLDEIVRRRRLAVEERREKRRQTEDRAFERLRRGESLLSLEMSERALLGREGMARLGRYREMAERGSIPTNWELYEGMRRLHAERTEAFAALPLASYLTALDMPVLSVVREWGRGGLALDGFDALLDRQFDARGIEEDAVRGRYAWKALEAAQALPEGRWDEMSQMERENFLFPLLASAEKQQEEHRVVFVPTVREAELFQQSWKIEEQRESAKHLSDLESEDDRKKFLTVSQGQFTFDNEGRDEEGRYFSRNVHWPGGASGVTIGRGFDMKERTREEVARLLLKAGIPKETSALISLGAGLEGKDAAAFVAAHKDKILLTREQQQQLFEATYLEYVKTMERVIGNWMPDPSLEIWTDEEKKEILSNDFKKIEVKNLPLKVQQVLADMTYHGLNTVGTRKIFMPPLLKDVLENKGKNEDEHAFDNFMESLQSSEWDGKGDKKKMMKDDLRQKKRIALIKGATARKGKATS